MLAPYKGRIYPESFRGCGSGGMFASPGSTRQPPSIVKRASARGSVQSEKFVEAHGGKLGDIKRGACFQLVWPTRRLARCSVRPSQSNSTTRRLAVMNPESFRGIEADFGPEHADTFRRDLHPDLRAGYVLANPPFNDSDTAPRGSAILQNRTNLQVVREAQDNFRKDDDVRWQWREATWTTTGSPKGEHNQAHQYPSPQRGNANFAWPRRRSGFIHHFAPHRMAGFVLVRLFF